MKSVLISIQPKWVEMIASGKKTIEVRKSVPKLERPFKCYIYCTIGNGVKGDYLVPSGIQCGKVIGEFVCDRIAGDGETIRGNACLTVEEIQDYCNGKDIYLWHISDLKIYDKPKDLSEFEKPFVLDNRPMAAIKREIFGKDWCHHFCSTCDCDEENCKISRIKKPPRSWCYVEVG